MHNISLISVYGLAIFLLSSVSKSIASRSSFTSYNNGAYGISGTTEGPVAGGMPLRIMCLGASLVKGEQSNGTVGFRKPMRDILVEAGNLVNMVGTEKVGEMRDNDVEARGGNRVDQVHDWAVHSVGPMKPNLLVVNVGTNDCLQRWHTADYHDRLKDFVEFLLKSSPRGTVLLSTLITNTVPDTEPCILDLNSQIRTLYQTLKSQKKHVVLAEMHYDFVPEGDRLDRPRPIDISPDGTHPEDAGYLMMAKVFEQSIRDIDSLGYFQRAENVSGIWDDGDAEKDAGGKQL